MDLKDLTLPFSLQDIVYCLVDKEIYVGEIIRIDLNLTIAGEGKYDYTDSYKVRCLTVLPDVRGNYSSAMFWVKPEFIDYDINKLLKKALIAMMADNYLLGHLHLSTEGEIREFLGRAYHNCANRYEHTEKDKLYIPWHHCE